MTTAQRAARSIVCALFDQLIDGELVLVEPSGRVRRFGPGGDLHARMELRDPRAWTMLLTGSRGLAESYVDGHWESDDLVSVIRLAARNVVKLDELRRRLASIRVPYQHVRGIRRANDESRSREDIHAHYDLGNDLFELMLDETMMYSSGWFPSPEATLKDASLAKLELVCDKLDLGPDDHLLEIGTGWGGMAIHAATTRGCRVTTTTISEEQRRLAIERVAAAGVADRVTVLSQDYRELTGTYDKLVSLEMIEAVGWRDFGTFFELCSDRLAPDDAMLLQAITMDDRAYHVEKASNSFIRTKIFPNGCLPSQEVIARCLKRQTDLRMAHHEDLSQHYVRTLHEWRLNMERHESELDKRGYDEHFRRLWRMYLCYCEGGFAERRIAVGQTLFAKPGWRGRVPETVLRGPAGMETRAAAGQPVA